MLHARCSPHISLSTQLCQLAVAVYPVYHCHFAGTTNAFEYKLLSPIADHNVRSGKTGDMLHEHTDLTAAG